MKKLNEMLDKMAKRPDKALKILSYAFIVLAVMNIVMILRGQGISKGVPGALGWLSAIIFNRIAEMWRGSTEAWRDLVKSYQEVLEQIKPKIGG